MEKGWYSVIRGVANIWMPVADTDRAVDFYENILGLPVVRRDGPWAELDANGVTVGLNGREPESSLEETVDDLKERGVEFPGEISEHYWGRVATFKDTEGNDIQLYEPPRS